MLNSRTLFLLLAYAVGLGWVGYELQRPQATAGDDPGGTTLTPPVIPTHVAPTTTIDAYAAIVERPLFNADRRPTPVDSGAPAPQDTTRVETVTDLGGIRLSAVLKSSDNLTALLELPDGTSKSVHRGELLGGWEVIEILDDRITVAADGRKKTLKVHDFTNIPAAKPTPPRRFTGTRNRRIPRTTPRPVRPTTQDMPTLPRNLINSREDPKQ